MREGTTSLLIPGMKLCDVVSISGLRHTPRNSPCGEVRLSLKRDVIQQSGNNPEPYVC